VFATPLVGANFSAGKRHGFEDVFVSKTWLVVGLFPLVTFVGWVLVFGASLFFVHMRSQPTTNGLEIQTILSIKVRNGSEKQSQRSHFNHFA
jgi:hypothetical protein